MKLIENYKKKHILEAYCLDKHIYNILFKYKLSTLKLLNEDMVNRINNTRNFTKLNVYDKYGILFSDDVIEYDRFKNNEKESYYRKLNDILSFCSLEDFKKLIFKYSIYDIDKEKYDKYLLDKRYDENIEIIKQLLIENGLDYGTNNYINLNGDISNYLKYIKILCIFFDKTIIQENQLIYNYKYIDKLIELVDIDTLNDITKDDLKEIIFNKNKIKIESLENLENYREYRNNYYENKYKETKEKKYLEEIICPTMNYRDPFLKRCIIKCIHDIYNLFTHDNIGIEKLSDLEIKYIKCVSLFNLEQYDNLYDYLVSNKFDFSEINYDELYDKIRLLYGNAYFNSLDTTDSLIEGATVKEKNGVKIYDMAELKEFKMLVHSIDRVGGPNKNINEKLYDNPNLYDTINGTNYVSCSYVTEDGLFCLNGNLIYGYNDIEHDAVVSISPGDAATSHDKNKDVKGAAREVLCLPENMIGKSYIYNEVSIKRYLEDGIRRKPKYILVFDNKIDGKEYEHARYFGIPIININRKPYAEKHYHQVKKIEQINRDDNKYKYKLISEYEKYLSFCRNDNEFSDEVGEKVYKLRKEVYGY